MRNQFLIEEIKQTKPTCYQLLLELEKQLPVNPDKDRLYEVKITGHYSSNAKKTVLHALGYAPTNKKISQEFKVKVLS